MFDAEAADAGHAVRIAGTFMTLTALIVRLAVCGRMPVEAPVRRARAKALGVGPRASPSIAPTRPAEHRLMHGRRDERHENAGEDDVAEKVGALQQCARRPPPSLRQCRLPTTPPSFAAPAARRHRTARRRRTPHRQRTSNCARIDWTSTSGGVKVLPPPNCRDRFRSRPPPMVLQDRIRHQSWSDAQANREKEPTSKSKPSQSDLRSPCHDQARESDADTDPEQADEDPRTASATAPRLRDQITSQYSTWLTHKSMPGKIRNIADAAANATSEPTQKFLCRLLVQTAAALATALVTVTRSEPPLP